MTQVIAHLRNKRFFAALLSLMLVWQLFAVVPTHAADISSIENSVNFTDGGKATVTKAEWSDLAPGVRMVKVSRTTEYGANNIVATFTDLDRADVRVIDSGSVSESKANLTKMANDTTKGDKVVVNAVNGAFFDIQKNRAPFGVEISDGQVVKTGEGAAITDANGDSKPLSQAQISAAKQGSVQATSTVTQGGVVTPTGVTELDGLNTVQVANDQLVAFNTKWGKISLAGYTVQNDAAAHYVTIDAAGNVTAAGTTAPTLPLDEGSWALVARGAAIQRVAGLTPGTKASVAFGARGINFAISGDKFVRLFTADSTPLTDTAEVPEANRGFVFNRHPRTGIGFRDGGKVMILVTVDGRAPGKSEGMALPEFGRLLRDLGATQAMNLDGGGSTSHSAALNGSTRNSFVNTPSDRGGRAIGNGVGVLVPKGDDKAVRFRALALEPSVEQGKTTQLQAIGFNANGFQVPGTPQGWVSNNPAVATVDNNGLVTAVAPGTVQIVAMPATKLEDAVTLQVTPAAAPAGAPAALAIEPEAVALAPQPTESSALIDIYGVDAAGTWTKLPFDQLIFETDRAGLTFAQAGDQVKVSDPVTMSNPPTPASFAKLNWNTLVTVKLKSNPAVSFKLPVWGALGSQPKGGSTNPPRGAAPAAPGKTYTGDEGATANVGALANNVAVLPEMRIDATNLADRKRLEATLQDIVKAGAKTILIPGNLVRKNSVYSLQHAKDIITKAAPGVQVIYVPGVAENGPHAKAELAAKFGAPAATTPLGALAHFAATGSPADAAAFDAFKAQLTAAAKAERTVIVVDGLDNLDDTKKQEIEAAIAAHKQAHKTLVISGTAAEQTVTFAGDDATVTRQLQADQCPAMTGKWQRFGAGDGEEWLKFSRHSVAIAGACAEPETGAALGLNSHDAKTNPAFTGSNTVYTHDAAASALPAAPEGFKQSYFATFVRHGSRALSGTNDYDDLIKMLTAAERTGDITQRGKELKAYLEELKKVQAKVGNGNLSTRGKTEMTEYGKRLAERHKALLDGKDGKIRLESSDKTRAKDSAKAISAGLTPALRPQVTIPKDPTVNKPVLQDFDEENSATNKAREAYMKNDPNYKKVKGLPGNLRYDGGREAAINLLSDFVTPSFAERNINGYCGGRAMNIFSSRGASVTLSEDGAKPYPQVNTEAAREIQLCTAIDEWYKRSQGFEGQDASYANGKPVLKDFFDSIDNAEKTGEVGSVRSGHNETLTPLNALLEVPGVRQRAKADGPLFNYKDYDFRQSETDPMGGNIEWIVYSNKAGKKLVLTLLNEKPVSLGRGCQPIAAGSLFYDYDQLKTCLPDVGQDKTPTVIKEPQEPQTPPQTPQDPQQPPKTPQDPQQPNQPEPPQTQPVPAPAPQPQPVPAPVPVPVAEVKLPKAVKNEKQLANTGTEAPLLGWSLFGAILVATGVSLAARRRTSSES